MNQLTFFMSLNEIFNYCCPIKLDNNKNSVLDC